MSASKLGSGRKERFEINFFLHVGHSLFLMWALKVKWNIYHVHVYSISYIQYIVRHYNKLFARSGHMVQNHTCWWASCTVGLPKQCHLYQSTWTCLCFGNSTAELAHQHVWFCTMWPDRAKGLLLRYNAIFSHNWVSHSVSWHSWDKTCLVLTHSLKQWWCTPDKICVSTRYKE